MDVSGFKDNSLSEERMVSKDGWSFPIDLVTSLTEIICHGTREGVQLLTALDVFSNIVLGFLPVCPMYVALHSWQDIS